MRITSKGQVTIPQDIRERFGLLPHTEVEFVVEGRQWSSSARPSRRATHGTRAGSHGRGVQADIKMTTDEIMRAHAR